jgi:hypothetical protein
MEQPDITEEKHEYSGRSRFILLIGGSILVACMLVFISLKLYDWSGASQLDFSLPSYNSLRQGINNDDSVNFSGTGAINQQVVDDFEQQFATQLEQAEKSNGFSSKALDDSSLGIRMPKE